MEKEENVVDKKQKENQINECTRQKKKKIYEHEQQQRNESKNKAKLMECEKSLCDEL